MKTMSRRAILGAPTLAASWLCLTRSAAQAVAPETTALTQFAPDLDNDASQWGVYLEGHPRWEKNNVAEPSVDGNALRLALTGGMPYSNAHFYYTLPPDSAAVSFELTCEFRFSATTLNNEGRPSRVQALEFTCNRWSQGQRHEFGAQWLNIVGGTGLPGPSWRLWSGAGWVDSGIRQALAGEQWHSLVLVGEIVGNQVRYVRLACDDVTRSLGHTYPPVAIPGDGVTVAFQLDGNYGQDPFELFLDRVSLRWDSSQSW